MMRQADESKGTRRSHHIFLNSTYKWRKEEQKKYIHKEMSSSVKHETQKTLNFTCCLYKYKVKGKKVPLYRLLRPLGLYAI